MVDIPPLVDGDFLASVGERQFLDKIAIIQTIKAGISDQQQCAVFQQGDRGYRQVLVCFFGTKEFGGELHGIVQDRDRVASVGGPAEQRFAIGTCTNTGSKIAGFCYSIRE